MYQVEYDGKILKPILTEKDAEYWQNRLKEFTPGSTVLLINLDGWMTANLPETNPPANCRPGAEYGVDV